MHCGYTIVTAADVALAAATAKSVLGIRGNAAFGVDLNAFKIGFDGVDPAGVPVLVELCYATFATNPPGTNSTSRTPAQVYGRVATHGFTGASNWTTEPTVLTVVDEWKMHPQSLWGEWVPFEKTWDSAFSEGFVLRCTAAAIVNLRASFKFERA